MKEEIQLVDIFAMFALHSTLQKGENIQFSEVVAESAYVYAEAMMEERKKLYGKNND